MGWLGEVWSLGVDLDLLRSFLARLAPGVGVLERLGLLDGVRDWDLLRKTVSLRAKKALVRSVTCWASEGCG